MTFPAGELDRRITFQQNTPVQNELGEPVPGWANIATNPTVWAKVMPLSQRELVEAGAPRTHDDRAFIVRFRTDITETMRVVYDGKNYDVEAVREATEYGRHVATRIIGRAVA